MAALAHAAELDAAIADRELHELVRRGDPRDRARVLGRRPGAGAARRGGFRGIGGARPVFGPASVGGGTLLVWLESDYGITLNGGNVSAWADRVPATDQGVSQGTAAIQPAYNATDAHFNNRPSLQTDGGDYLSDDAIDAALSCLHSGVGGTLVVVPRFTTSAGVTWSYAGNCQGTSAKIGFAIWGNAVDQKLSYLVGNGAGAGASGTSANGTVTRDAPHVIAARIRTADFDVRCDGTSILSGTPIALSTADPTHAMQVFALGNNGFPMPSGGKLTALLVYASYLSNADLDALRTRYLKPKYGTP